ncbi:putative DNA primase/helicase [Rhizobiales bacterium GAS188]|nr:putative DNA primase/helicase [Rhizobiales bacterium GAS188]
MAKRSSVLAALAAAEVAAPGDGALDRELAELPRNDIGNAKRFLARHSGRVLFVRNMGWLVWDARRWRREGGDEAARTLAQNTTEMIRAEARAVADEAEGYDGKAKKEIMAKAEALMRFASSSGKSSNITGMMREAAPHFGGAVWGADGAFTSAGPGDLDADPLTLNCLNGTLTVRVVERVAEVVLKDHDPADRITKLCEAAYKPDAEAPQFLAFLERIVPDKDVREFLKLFCGYCLTGLTREQIVVFLHGAGANGKSTFVDLVASIMGDYSVTLQFASLTAEGSQRRGGEATPDLARLPGARFVRASEPEMGVKFSEALVKSLTGGETVTVRHLNQGFFDFDPEYKIVLSGNHKPIIRGQDEGIWRRVRLIPFEVSIPKEERDRELAEKLWEERDGVLAWMVEGLCAYLEGGLSEPAAILTATAQYREESDAVGQFITQCITVVKGAQPVQSSEIYANYEKYARINGTPNYSATGFGKAFRERIRAMHGIERIDGMVRVYPNIVVAMVDARDDVQARAEAHARD